MITPVHKKGNKSVIKNYRPVSLLSIVSKVFEKLIHRDIYKHLETHKIINNRQHGFRKHRSAADLHLLLSSKWSHALDKGLQTLVLALDIEGAFDRVWHDGLYVKLESVGIKGKLLALLKAYLSRRSLRVCVNGVTSEQYPVEAGVPQGSVLGPLLWLVYINDCLNILPEADAFADDVTLSRSCTPKQLKATVVDFNRRLVLLHQWGELWQVRFAGGKTQFLVIWRSPVNISIRFENCTIENSSEIDILGLCYDKHLSFQQHISKVAKKTAGKLVALRRIGWAVDTSAKEILYKFQIRSAMEFSPLTWVGAASTHMELLNKVQRRAERIIYGDQNENTNFDTLQHRRDVAGLSVIYKIQLLDVDHLRPLRQAPRPVPRPTRAATADAAGLALKEERCNTHHSQLKCLPRYTRMWNVFVSSTSEQVLHDVMRNIKNFKCAVNKWLLDR